MAGKSAPHKRARPEYFDGRVSLSEISTECSQRARIYRVKFHAGARTKLHRHTGVQVLVGVSGRGSLIIYKKERPNAASGRITRISKARIAPGGVAYVPAGAFHTHGAEGGGTFTHIAINLPARGRESAVAWYDSDFESRAVRI